MVQAIVLVGWLVASSVTLSYGSADGGTSCVAFQAQLEALEPMAAASFGVDCDDIGLPSPSAGFCDLLSTTHAECSSCCETDARITNIGCTALGNTLCRTPVCRTLATGLCGQVSAALKDACLDSDCSGKPGDPACSEPPPPCPSSCQFECGVTQKGVCGDCSYLNPDFVCCGG